MSEMESLQRCRALRAELYAKAAQRMAEALAADPAGKHWDHYVTCIQAWGMLADVDARIRNFTIAGDPIDDYYRRQEAPTNAEPSYADKVNEPLSPTTIAALNAELASDNYARFRKARADGAP